MKYRLIRPDGYKKPIILEGKEWVKALQSGNYKQGVFSLCNSGEYYSCLGVLSKIQGRLNGDRDLDSDVGVLSNSNPLFDVLKSEGVFPEYVGVFIDTQFRKSKLLTNLNECNNNGLTFSQIADIIVAIWDCGIEEAKTEKIDDPWDDLF